MADLKRIIARLADGHRLERAEARDAIGILMSGEATPAQVGAMLMAMRVRGETAEEVTGAVEAMRGRMLRVTAPDDAIDIVGTGGDARGSLNISTAAALVTAACGVPVAKHGNRALSSRSGAADVLMALGVKVDLTPDQVSACIRQAGVGFMFAPAHHPAMRHVGPARVELGTRTIFNLLGPLSNPAGVRRQLIGVFAPQWLEVMARSLADLGSDRVWVVHGQGYDEIAINGPTEVAILDQGRVERRVIEPAEAGLPVHDEAGIAGGDATFNAAALRDLLAGQPSAYRDMVVLNAAAALIVAGRTDTLADGAVLAASAIDDGRARGVLDRLIVASNEAAA